MAEGEVVAAADVRPVAVGAAGARRSSFTEEEMFDFNRRWPTGRCGSGCVARRAIRLGDRQWHKPLACRIVSGA